MTAKKKQSYRFHISGPSDKLIKTFLYKHGHQYTQRDTTAYDIVLFTGGADVSPFLYGERKLDVSHVDYARDMEDIKSWQAAGTRFPKVGICRGAQFLNVMSGGRLWQDVNCHYSSSGGVLVHDMTIRGTGEVISTTSTHHQQMRVGVDGEILALACLSTLKKADGDSRIIENPATSALDPEVVWYPDTMSLCFQGHPEYHNARPDFINYFFAMIDKYLGPAIIGEV